MIIFRFLVPSLFMAIGLMFLLTGYKYWDKSYELVDSSVSAPGVIVEIVPYLSSRKIGKSISLNYFPEVKYTTAKGEKVTFRSQVTSRADHYKPGDKVRVLYKEDNPQEAVIGSFSALWAVCLIFGTSGVLVILVASWFFRRAFEGEKKKT